MENIKRKNRHEKVNVNIFNNNNNFYNYDKLQFDTASNNVTVFNIIPLIGISCCKL